MPRHYTPKWVADNQFTVYLRDTSNFANRFSDRFMRCLQGELEAIQVDWDDTYSKEEKLLTSVVRVSANGNTKQFINQDRANISESNLSPSITNELINAPVVCHNLHSPLPPQYVPLPDSEEQDDLLIHFSQELPPADTADEEDDEIAEVADLDGADAVPPYIGATTHSTPPVSANATSPGNKDEFLLCPGYLMLVATVNYSSQKLIVDGPFTKWFLEYEYPQLTPDNSPPIPNSTPLKKSRRRTTRTSKKPVPFTPAKSKSPPKTSTRSAWELNIDRTITKIDAAMCDLQGEVHAAILPVAEENNQLRSQIRGYEEQCAELKSRNCFWTHRYSLSINIAC